MQVIQKAGIKSISFWHLGGNSCFNRFNYLFKNDIIEKSGILVYIEKYRIFVVLNMIIKIKTTNKTTIKTNQIKKVVMISGGFDPIHIGHIRYIQEASKLGDTLIVVINNDNWLQKKKGKEFMSAIERKEIIEAIVGVDKVVISSHKKNPTDMSVCTELKKIKPHVFANGGDRFADNIPEFQLCNELDIEMVFNVGRGGKVRSSSELLKEYANRIQK